MRSVECKLTHPEEILPLDTDTFSNGDVRTFDFWTGTEIDVIHDIVDSKCLVVIKTEYPEDIWAVIFCNNRENEGREVNIKKAIPVIDKDRLIICSTHPDEQEELEIKLSNKDVSIQVSSRVKQNSPFSQN
ncbi:hypothetical protein A2164_00895 [Candidatus Curtissbacteria bacterium RBG_13_35_7]|uniref:Uncharacterized protein n=1 Tax=Candidatus Curtissbacteria bacterium RBG_13_35_7 TaxID=1797705 RepID=A0A1F5G5J1_9BACT|nr:MAG: hypothetical protein A2164_00895 [Candidatus Curtissbacteria bacterium RBG_13_35_7]